MEQLVAIQRQQATDIAQLKGDDQALTLADSLAVAVADNGQVNADSWQKAVIG
jgi:hypothetical protein